MLLLSVKKTIIEDNALSQKKDVRSHPSLPNLQAGLFPGSLFYLVSSVRASGYKEDANIFGHQYNQQRENERGSANLQ